MSFRDGAMNTRSGGRKITVAGCGHVGLVTAAGLAELGHDVIGLDIQPDLIERLSAGQMPFLEPGLEDLVRQNRERGRLRFTTSYSEALRGAEIVLLCVNTPSTVTGAADLSYVRSAAMEIGRELARTDSCPLVVNKSTSPIGTGETIYAVLSQFWPLSLGRPRIASNPEFLREGHAVDDFFHPERIVVGAESEADAEELRDLYGSIEAPVIVTDVRSAEMIKYASNGFLATRVSYVNELARLCEPLGIDVDAVIQGTGLDSRIGTAFFNPGIGYGGSCLPKDVAALCHMADSAGVTMRVLSAVQEANLGQRRYAANCIRQALGSLEGRTVAVFGAAFKGGSEDLRESPALDVIRLLLNEGARVRLYDPALGDDIHIQGNVNAYDDPYEAARDADALAVLTDWRQFRDLDFILLHDVMVGRYVYDGRNVLDRATVEGAGFIYQGVGRGAHGRPVWPTPAAELPGAEISPLRAADRPSLIPDQFRRERTLESAGTAS